ncbi:MAG: hypothetical protein ACJ8C4_04975 [Gemmataceae bacterium]
MLLSACALLVFAVAGTADEKHVMKEQSKNPAFEKMKTLVGEWVMADDKGNPTDQIVLSTKIISAGSAIHETIFPGQPHEMVTVYHMDGNDVVATHYCALGNQPKLKVDASGLPKTLKFNFNGGSNMDPAKDMHMHEGSVTFIDDDHIESSWQAYQNGKPAGDQKMTMKLVRKKKA